jgi:hypothetical protein
MVRVLGRPFGAVVFAAEETMELPPQCCQFRELKVQALHANSQPLWLIDGVRRRTILIQCQTMTTTKDPKYSALI